MYRISWKCKCHNIPFNREYDPDDGKMEFKYTSLAASPYIYGLKLEEIIDENRVDRKVLLLRQG